MNKFIGLILLSVFSALLISGCVGPGPTTPEQIEGLVANLNVTQTFLSQYPTASIVAVFLDASTVQSIFSELNTTCGPQMQVKSYWKVTVSDPAAMLNLVMWIDADTQQAVCVIKVPVTVVAPVNVTIPVNITKEVVGYDVCDNEIGGSVQPPYEGWMSYRWYTHCEKKDCCCCFVKTHTLDFGTAFANREVELNYTFAPRNSAVNTYTVKGYFSADEEKWTEFYSKQIEAVATGENKIPVSERLAIKGVFRYVKLDVETYAGYLDSASGLVLGAPVEENMTRPVVEENVIVKSCHNKDTLEVEEAMRKAKNPCWGWLRTHTYVLDKTYFVTAIKGSVNMGMSELGRMVPLEIQVSADGETFTTILSTQAMADFSTMTPFSVIVNENIKAVRLYSRDNYVDTSAIKVYFTNITEKPPEKPQYLYYDRCDNDVGYSVPGIGAYKCGKVDCCGWYQKMHIHDLGTIISGPVTLGVRYTPGYNIGCKSEAVVSVSPDDETWREVGRFPTVSATSVPGKQAWITYSQDIASVTNFRYVKITIYPCYNDYSEAFVYKEEVNVTMCADGTPYGQCVSKLSNKYCENGTLVDKCSVCGCPTSEVPQLPNLICNITSETCYTPVEYSGFCADGTVYGQCSATRPKYCDNGTLVDKCGLCGCPADKSCNPDGTCTEVAALCTSFVNNSVNYIDKNTMLCPEAYYNASVSITMDNVVLDCNGALLKGLGYSYPSYLPNAIYLSGRQNVTVKNCNLQNWGGAISLDFSNNNLFTNNDALYSYKGIYLWSSSNNTLTNNNASNNWEGIHLIDSRSNTLTNNSAYNNSYNIILEAQSNNNILTSNKACKSTFYDYYDILCVNNAINNSGSGNTADKVDCPGIEYSAC